MLRWDAFIAGINQRFPTGSRTLTKCHNQVYVAASKAKSLKGFQHSQGLQFHDMFAPSRSTGMRTAVDDVSQLIVLMHIAPTVESMAVAMSRSVGG
jgi:hypothetical protein